MSGGFKEYWRRWLWRDATTRLMTVCIAVWIVVGAGWLAAPHLAPGGEAARMRWLCFWGVPSRLGLLASRPWTPLTYMVTHVEFVHLMVNMVWWLLFGGLYERAQGGGRTVALYIYGGLAGAAAFVAYPDGGTVLVGASCSVMAAVGATVALMPKQSVNLLLFGPVRTVWLGVVAVLFLVVLSPGAAEGVAHGAALAAGAAIGLLRRRGVDVTVPLTWLFDRFGRLFSRTPTAQPRAERRSGGFSRGGQAGAEEELDILLEKVSRSGYGSLSARERQRLFDLSQRFNNTRR